MDNKRLKIIETIAKMSRLTEEGSGAFMGEISNASAKIAELMEKYAISQIDVQNFMADKQEKEFAQEFTSEYSEHRHTAIKEWNWRLARLVARVTMTRHYSSGGRMVFFGVAENAKIASDMYVLWLHNIEDMARKATDDNFKELIRKYGNRKQFRHWIAVEYPEDDPRYFRSSWISGCLNAMFENVAKEERERELEREEHAETAKSNALVLYKQEIIKAYSNIMQNSRTVHTSSSKGFSNSGYIKGKQTGSRIRIQSKQVGG